MITLTPFWLIISGITAAILLIFILLLIQRHLHSNNQMQLLTLKLQQVSDAKEIQNKQWMQTLVQYQAMEVQLNQQNIHNAALKEKLNLLTVYQTQNQQLEDERNALRIQYTEQLKELSEIKTRLKETKLSADEKLQLINQNKAQLTEQFENLANRIFTNNSKKLEEQNTQSLHHLLTPLKDQLDGFRKQVQDSFGQEAKERHTLAHEIRNLQDLNTKMAKEAINLTNALKGNNKIQGNWGEVILNHILDSSGLREGHEYDTQVSLHNASGKKQQPDVIVHLPQGNKVIIDAKVTLTAYERYFNSDDDYERKNKMGEHVTAIRQHIKQLSNKSYHELLGKQSLDYILMFIPIEPAFLTAIDHDSSLINEALKYNIMLVSPTTLLVALRTINNLWRYEHQNRHAQDIAEKAAKLYDKMRGFIDDMENLGTHIKRSEKAYNDAMTKITKGRGNAIGQIEQFRHLGIAIKKPISPHIAESALDEFFESQENSPEKVSKG